MEGHCHHTPQIPNMLHFFGLGVVGRVDGADPDLALSSSVRLQVDLPSGPRPPTIQTGRRIVIN